MWGDLIHQKDLEHASVYVYNKSPKNKGKSETKTEVSKRNTVELRHIVSRRGLGWR